MSEKSVERSELLTLTSDIVANHATKNAVPSADLSELIETVFNTLSGLSAPPAEPEQKPAVPIKKSVSKQFIACLECGKQQKMLKRHLHTAHDTNPIEYRAKWGLAHDYPMVAPVYRALRRKIAKEIGLGRKRKS
ncbi:MAG: MucR family transcriptional regulator [Alphaproteobacteria bacterium]